MRVTDDVTRLIDLLGSSIVVGLSIYEIAGLKVVDRHFDVESGVGLEILTVHGRLELG